VLRDLILSCALQATLSAMWFPSNLALPIRRDIARFSAIAFDGPPLSEALWGGWHVLHIIGERVHIGPRLQDGILQG
jgi:hypothetical protein